MKIARVGEMKDIDRLASQDYGIPSLILMENAGLRVTEAVENHLDKLSGRRVVIVAGKGNNGGDGMVVARHLINSGVTVETFLLGRPEGMTPDARINHDIISKMGGRLVPLYSEEELEQFIISVLDSDLIVDAMYGTSFKGRLNEFDARVVRIINRSQKPVIAIDIPSGVEADTGKVEGEAVQATWTVTLALPKLGLMMDPGQNYTGMLTVADISIPAALLSHPQLRTNLITEDMVKGWFGPRPSESHKGTYGHVMVMGGSRD